MIRKRSPVPKPTIRHPDRKKEADRMACRKMLPEQAMWDITVAMARALDSEIIQEHLDAIEVRNALAEEGEKPHEQVKEELGL